MVLLAAPALGTPAVSHWSPELTLASHEQLPNAVTTTIWHRGSMWE